LLLVHSFRGELEKALAAGERALALSPNNAEILAEFGMRLALMGQWERGIALIDEATARNPAHPGWYHTALALNLYRQGRYAQALEEAKQIDAPGWVHNHTILAMITASLDRQRKHGLRPGAFSSWIRISRRTPGTSFSSATSRSRWRSTWPRACAKQA
jgi:tetratricopeptide (TPR) repeat protein